MRKRNLFKARFESTQVMSRVRKFFLLLCVAE